ncbi:TetR/AcrR family transcriptional regulator [Ketobacter sp. MCCC 1A13808]|uniref:TetR/AcrR family transcriptional regulator n=1 Tax=Ketobacter sp. MCCC 1A13808 TaxID=2602738 RepID=UPI000F140262|nr:TetR/AcrR family transcriptional regulator [Ketobacter sp. MCCC 1A13808]MVF14402.1 TetR/AcrR family transcriptional regulator [Ketobacter sp. MCCC 1A13808]RLP52224.1 MAG: TetR/AcrR family transcriptional regulator [Ketobacter sp.]
MASKVKKLANGMEDTPRGRLLAAAAHLFRTKGFERTTVRDLAQEVGIQSGSIFHHFKSKEEILRCVMEEVIHFNTGRMREGLDKSAGPRDKLLALIRSELNSINGETGEAMAVLIYEWRCLTPESQEHILELRSHYEQLWLDTLKEAQQAGLIAPQRDLFVLRRLMAGAISWSHYWYKTDGEIKLDQLAHQALFLALHES